MHYSQAYDFEKDGIYYNILPGNNQVEVTDNASFSDAYFGNVTIPATVNYNGRNYSVFSIGSLAFAACPDLLSVNIEAQIKLIEESAFAGCSNLSEIIFPNTLINIGNGAFSECVSLTNLELPNSLLIIGDVAFYGCATLQEVTIPDSVYTIGDGAFANCSNLNEIVIGKSLQSGMNAFRGSPIVTAYINSGFVPTELLTNCETLQNLYLGDSVTTISPAAFQNCTSLFNIEFDSSLRIIYENAFENCVSLETLAFPPSVEYIMDYAFCNCSELKSLDLANVSSLGEGAFDSCSSLTELIIPDSVKVLSPYAFAHCTNLKSVEIGKSVIFQSLSPRIFLDSPIETATLNCTAVGSNLFNSFTTLKTVVLNGNVTRIDSDAFNGCTQLENIELTDAINYIGSGAFMDCRSLSAIEIPERITAIEYSTFSGCSGLNSVTLPSSLVIIGDGAFQNCLNLKGVEFPEGLEEIAAYAFAGCASLENVIIPEGVETIGICGFQNCSSLKEVTIGSVFESLGDPIYVGVENRMVFEGCPIEIATINCREVSRGLFQTPTLKTVNLGAMVEKIGSQAFWRCTGLVNIILPEQLVEVGGYAFQDCSSLTSVDIPDGVVRIGGFAFEGSGLKNLTIGKGLNQIGDGVFYGCPIESATINSIMIPARLLYNSPVSDLILGESVENIGNYAFAETANLKEVKLPKTVNYIGDEAFSGGGLEKVVCQVIQIPELGYFCFKNTYETKPILYVPEEVLNDYKESEWSWYFSQILPIDNAGINEIPDNDFSGRLRVYDFSGKLILDTTDFSEIKTLNRGFYIINGKKVLIGE